MKKKIHCGMITFLGIILVLLISILMVTNLKIIYDFSVTTFNIESKVSLSKENMMENYSYIVDYIVDDGSDFNLPSLPSSQDGAIHFNEVRDLFNLAKSTILMVATLLIVLLIVYTRVYKDILYTKYLGITLITLPIILSAIVSINFKFFFNLFHKIFFNNDKWIFDPKTDPIINILPEEFFALCGIAILALCIFMGIVMYIIYFINKKIKSAKNGDSVL